MDRRPMTALEKMLARSTFSVIKDLGRDWPEIDPSDTGFYLQELEYRIGATLMGLMCMCESTGRRINLQEIADRAARALILAAETVPDDEDQVRNLDLDEYQAAVDDLMRMRRDGIRPEDITGGIDPGSEED